MSDFKVGDRVRGKTHIGESPYARTYEGTIRGFGTVTAGLDTDDDGFQYVYAETLEAVEPYTPKVGDRVRFVQEGVVDGVSETWLTIDGTGRLLGKGETVELLEKAPEPVKAYRPGTVVRGSMYTWIVTDKGSIALETATGHVAVKDCSVTGAELAEGQPVAGYEIVYEPPTS